MRVSELADRAGTTSAAIRFYESQGFLPAPPRAANGYREYADADVCRLRVLTSLRGLGVDLAEAGRLATMCAEGSKRMSAEVAARVEQRRGEVARARAELEHLDAELANLERALVSGDACELLCPGKEGCC
ncbi:MAG TPA: MerR family transcriptional regulator [Candidatus Limnocylindrales bacterium]|jgi:DNA-binding transcriptional MerR regulator